MFVVIGVIFTSVGEVKADTLTTLTGTFYVVKPVRYAYYDNDVPAERGSCTADQVGKYSPVYKKAICTKYDTKNDAAITVTLDKSVYAPGEKMTIKGTMKGLWSSDSNPDVSLGYGIDVPATPYNIFYAHGLNGGSSYSNVVYPNAPTVAGDHNINFFADEGPYNKGNYSMSFKISAPVDSVNGKCGPKNGATYPYGTDLSHGHGAQKEV